MQANMRKHNANLCLTLLDAEYKEDYTAFREMIINIEKPNGIKEDENVGTIIFNTKR
jgi:hypothetical protein